MNEQRLLDTFFDLVRIDSPSRYEARMAAQCKGILVDMGFEVRIDGSARKTGSNVGNIIAHLQGTRPGHIVFSAHMDCVDPCCDIEPVATDGIIRSAGDTVLGADDKAGIAIIFEALRAVIEEGAPRPDITVLLSTCEELSLLGSSALDSDLFEGDVPCFVFDAQGSPGTIVLGAPFHYTLRATFRGKAAHAGVEPERGVSAIEMAAEAIGTMELGRLGESTTANIGMIEGGHEVNVVADECVLKGECRSLHGDKVEACRAQITESLQASADRYGGEVDIAWRLDYPGVLFQREDPFIDAVVDIVVAAGLTPQFAYSGGGSDANVLSTKGLKAVALGIGMSNFHGTDEFIAVEDLSDGARLAAALIQGF